MDNVDRLDLENQQLRRLPADPPLWFMQLTKRTSSSSKCVMKLTKEFKEKTSSLIHIGQVSFRYKPTSIRGRGEAKHFRTQYGIPCKRRTGGQGLLARKWSAHPIFKSGS